MSNSNKPILTQELINKLKVKLDEQLKDDCYTPNELLTLVEAAGRLCNIEDRLNDK